MTFVIAKLFCSFVGLSAKINSWHKWKTFETFYVCDILLSKYIIPTQLYAFMSFQKLPPTYLSDFYLVFIFYVYSYSFFYFRSFPGIHLFSFFSFVVLFLFSVLDSFENKMIIMIILIFKNKSLSNMVRPCSAAHIPEGAEQQVHAEIHCSYYSEDLLGGGGGAYSFFFFF